MSYNMKHLEIVLEAEEVTTVNIHGNKKIGYTAYLTYIDRLPTSIFADTLIDLDVKIIDKVGEILY